MTNAIIPVTGFPVQMRPYNNITPFTYRDGLTYLEVLESLRTWLRDNLVPFLDSEITALTDDFTEQVVNLMTSVDLALTSQATAINAALLDQLTTVTDSLTTQLNTVTDTMSEQTTSNATKLAETVAYVDAAVQSIINSTIAVTDPVLVGVFENRAANSTTILYNAFGDVESVLAYGAIGDGLTDDKTAIDLAIAAAANGGIVRFPKGKVYSTSGGHVFPVGVLVDITGSSIIHTGNNTLFEFNRSGGFNLNRANGVVGGKITGNAGVNAVGISYGNAWGFHVTNTSIQNYSAGVAILSDNITNWSEGSALENIMFQGNKVGIRFRNSTGTQSFGYTAIKKVSINVNADCIGIDFGSESPTGLYVYNSEISADIWLYGNNAIGINLGANLSMDANIWHVTGEVFGTLTNAYGLQNLGGSVSGIGFCNVKGSSNNLALGKTRFLAQSRTIDTASGTNTTSGDIFTTVVAANIDTTFNGNMGFIGGSNRSIPFVSGFEGSDGFRVYKTAYNSKPSDGTELLSVRGDGSIRFGNTGKATIHAGTGSPATSLGSIGSIYLRTDSALEKPQIYIKLTNGWASLVTHRNGNTSSRPALTAGQDRGVMYYDETIERPIWWNGFFWITAAGAQV